MRKPFNVYGRKVKIKAVKDLAEKRGALGLYQWRSKTISYESSLKGDELMQTILHELFHAYCDRLGVQQMPSWTVDTEERIADEFAQVLIDNFKLTRR